MATLEHAVPGTSVTRTVLLDTGHVHLTGDLVVPPAPIGLVLFAHGSGSSRLSERNRFVAKHLQQRRLATLLFDLLTNREAMDRSLVFDIVLLADRLLAATVWARTEPGLTSLPICYFGASTGAAAALTAAAAQNRTIAAVVSRGGRPDLAAERLSRVTAPTLLIVGGEDVPVIAMNRKALAELAGPKRMVIVPGATHLFEEPGALERVADLAANWFTTYLSPLLMPSDPGRV